MDIIWNYTLAFWVNQSGPGILPGLNYRKKVGVDRRGVYFGTHFVLGGHRWLSG